MFFNFISKYEIRNKYLFNKIKAFQRSNSLNCICNREKAISLIQFTFRINNRFSNSKQEEKLSAKKRIREEMNEKTNGEIEKKQRKRNLIEVIID